MVKREATQGSRYPSTKEYIKVATHEFNQTVLTRLGQETQNRIKR